MTLRQVASCIAGVLVGLLMIGTAQAGLVLDLRLAGGNSLVLTPAMLGSDVSIQVWAKVTGAAGNSATEGFAFYQFSVRSAETAGGALSGSLATLGFIAPFDGTGRTSAGTGRNLNTVADNVVDLGVSAVTGTGNDIIKFGSTAMTIAGTGGGNAITDGWEWNGMTIGLHFDAALMGSLNDHGGSTSIGVFLPTSKVGIANGSWRVDGATMGSYPQVAVVGTSVTFTLEQTVVEVTAATNIPHVYAVDDKGMNALLAGAGEKTKGFGTVAGTWWDLDGVAGFETLQTGDSLEVTYADLVALGYLENETRNIKFQVRTNDGKMAESTAPMTMTLLPEPATMALMGLGLAAIVARRRARR